MVCRAAPGPRWGGPGPTPHRGQAQPDMPRPPRWQLLDARLGSCSLQPWSRVSCAKLSHCCRLAHRTGADTSICRCICAFFNCVKLYTRTRMPAQVYTLHACAHVHVVRAELSRTCRVPSGSRTHDRGGSAAAGSSCWPLAQPLSRVSLWPMLPLRIVSRLPSAAPALPALAGGAHRGAAPLCSRHVVHST